MLHQIRDQRHEGDATTGPTTATRKSTSLPAIPSSDRTDRPARPISACRHRRHGADQQFRETVRSRRPGNSTGSIRCGVMTVRADVRARRSRRRHGAADPPGWRRPDRPAAWMSSSVARTRNRKPRDLPAEGLCRRAVPDGDDPGHPVQQLLLRVADPDGRRDVDHRRHAGPAGRRAALRHRHERHRRDRACRNRREQQHRADRYLRPAAHRNATVSGMRSC
jgi:hypothetical protein